MSSAGSPPPSAPAAETDPLDCLDTPEMKTLLSQRASSFPTAAPDIERFLEAMPIMTTTIPSSDTDKSADLSAIEALAGEERPEDRVEALKQSGNQTWKLAQALSTDADKTDAALLQLKDDLARGRAKGRGGLTDAEVARLEKEIDRLEDKAKRQRAAHQRKVRDAFTYYSQAIELDTFMPMLASSVLSNRALVSLTLENYGHALADARLAIKKDRNNAKAWYRGATALLRLERLAMAKEWVEGGLGCKRAGKGELEALRRLKVEVEEAERAEQEKARRREEQRVLRAKAEEQRRKEEAAERAAVDSALAERGLSLGPALFAASDERKDADSDDDSPAPSSSSPALTPYRGRIRVLDDGSLSFPLLFLYPSHQQSDHIEQHHELAPLHQSLALLFPPSAPSPPWDQRGEYRLGELDVWVEVRGRKGKGEGDGVVDAEQGMVRVRVDAELSLLSVLTLPALRRRKYAVPGVPTFVVTLKGHR